MVGRDTLCEMSAVGRDALSQICLYYVRRRKASSICTPLHFDREVVGRDTSCEMSAVGRDALSQICSYYVRPHKANSICTYSHFDRQVVGRDAAEQYVIGETPRVRRRQSAETPSHRYVCTMFGPTRPITFVLPYT